jgi:hypothetical protein
MSFYEASRTSECNTQEALCSKLKWCSIDDPYVKALIAGCYISSIAFVDVAHSSQRSPGKCTSFHHSATPPFHEGEFSSNFGPGVILQRISTAPS